MWGLVPPPPPPPHSLFQLVIPSQNYKLMIIIGLIACVCIGILVGVICVAAPNDVRPLSPPCLKPLSLLTASALFR